MGNCGNGGRSSMMSRRRRPRSVPKSLESRRRRRRRPLIRPPSPSPSLYPRVRRRKKYDRRMIQLQHLPKASILHGGILDETGPWQPASLLLRGTRDTTLFDICLLQPGARGVQLGGLGFRKRSMELEALPCGHSLGVLANLEGMG